MYLKFFDRKCQGDVEDEAETEKEDDIILFKQLRHQNKKYLLFLVEIS